MSKAKPGVQDAVTLPELATRLKAVRSSRTLTQAVVSSAAGKNTATYTDWESGTTAPGALALTRACLFMGITPNDVLIGNGTLAALDGVSKDDKAELINIITRVVALQRSGKAKGALQAFSNVLKLSCQLAGIE